MPRPKKISSLESLVDQIVNRAASEIAATVRLSISEEVRRLVGTGAKAAPSAAAAQKAPAAKQPATQCYINALSPINHCANAHIVDG